jgi:hypothetical protein
MFEEPLITIFKPGGSAHQFLKWSLKRSIEGSVLCVPFQLLSAHPCLPAVAILELPRHQSGNPLLLTNLLERMKVMIWKISLEATTAM